MNEAAFKVALTRAEALYAFYVAERRAGVDALTANERMHEHAKYLDGETKQAAE